MPNWLRIPFARRATTGARETGGEKMPMTTDAAEVLALRSLGWLAGRDDLFDVFLGAGGVDRADLAARAQDPEFLAAVLDFILMDDAWIVAFCDAEGLAYDSLQAARAALPGGAQVHWT